MTTTPLLVTELKKQVQNSLTYDIAVLRYMKQPFYVFFPDSLGDDALLQDKVPKAKSMKKVSSIAVSNESFFAFHNEDPSLWHFDDYFFTLKEPVRSVEGCEEVMPHKVLGKIYECSLQDLIELDTYYDNGLANFRRKTQVKKGPSSKEVLTCFMYTAKVQDLFPERNGRYLKAEGIQLKPYNFNSTLGVYKYATV